MSTFAPSAVHVGYQETLAYTAPAGGAVLLEATMASVVTDNVNVSLFVRIGSEDFYLLKDAVIPEGAALSCLGGKVALRPGDELFAIASVNVATPPAEAADLYVTALEL